MLQGYFLTLMTKLSCVALNEEKQIRLFRWRECIGDSISKPFSEYPAYIQKQKGSNYRMVVFF